MPADLALGRSTQRPRKIDVGEELVPDGRERTHPSIAIRADRRSIVTALGISIVVLIVLSLAGQFARHVFGMPTLFGLIDFFFVEGELTVPAWFSGMQLAFCALLLFLVARQKRAAGDRFARHWLGLCAVFVFLSMDELAGAHERLMPLMSRIWETPRGMWAATWVLPMLVPLAVLEVRHSFAYAMFTHVEEFLEMAGILLFVDFLLRRLEEGPGFGLAFVPSGRHSL